MLQVKVPSIFSGMQGFPARRDGRYHLRLSCLASFPCITFTVKFTFGPAEWNVLNVFQTSQHT